VNDKQDFKPEWREDKLFEKVHEYGTVSVVVSKSNHRTPAFRIQIGFRHNDRVVPSYQVKFVTENGAVATSAPPSNVITELWEQALRYTHEERQKAEDSYQEWKRKKDQQNTAPGQRPGLKSLKKRDKKSWEDRQAAKKEQQP
jgi:hypothetical protein